MSILLPHEGTERWFLGIDPGSSKPWPAFVAFQAPHAPRPTLMCPEPCIWPIANITGLVDLVCELAKRAVVFLALDAPIKWLPAFGHAAMAAAGPYLSQRHYPFNVNPFTTRPCEKALTSCTWWDQKGQNRQHQHPELVERIAELCNWTDDQRLPFVRHEDRAGVSVLGYMAAPHGPVVRRFLEQLSCKAAESETRLSLSVREAAASRDAGIYVLESHPAVAMAFWARYGLLGTQSRVHPYKRGGEAFAELRGAVIEYARAAISVSDITVRDDDALDSLVGLLGLVELVGKTGTWFGTDELGYFLVPKDPAKADFADLWETAGAQP